VIELARSQLDEREQQRWGAMLAQTPLVVTRAWWSDPELPTLAATLCLAPYVLTFAPFALEAQPALAFGVRALAAAVWLLSARACARGWRARDASWPTGRFLFPWGYAEVERDVLRMVPLAELRHEIRGRTLGVGTIKICLRAGRWSTVLPLSADEVERVAMAFEDVSSALVPFHAGGYRDSVRTRRSAGAPWARRSGGVRELAWAALAAIVGAAVPPATAELAAMANAAPVIHRPWRNEEGLRASWVALLHPRLDQEAHPHVSIELGQCSNAPVIVSTVASYLDLALTTPHLGPAHPYLPVLAAAEPEPARLWADCTWEVDRTTGTFQRARARWGLDRDGETVVERRATVEVGEVIRLVDQCASSDRSGLLSPEGIATASILLLEGAIRADVYEDGGASVDGGVWAIGPGCIAAEVARVTVETVEPSAQASAR
jgi:hypothetical protein